MTTVSSQDRAWRKSRRSNSGTNCVEVTMDVAEDGTQDIRDSKNRSGPTLRFDRATVAGLMEFAKRQ